MQALAFGLWVQVPEWLTIDFILKILDSKIFSAIYWGSAAVVLVLGMFAKAKYRDKNLKKLLNAYVEKATRGEGTERRSVKAVIKRAIEKARGLKTKGATASQFNASDVFENAARFFAQSQPQIAIDLLQKEADTCEATITYCRHQLRAAQQRAATAYLEKGMILREQDKGAEALKAFNAMLRVNHEDLDALQMLGVQCRDLKLYDDAERWFRTLLYLVEKDPAAAADVKREIGLVFFRKPDYPRAEQILTEALETERSCSNQRGEALTHELIGLVHTGRKGWPRARRAYQASIEMFRTIGDKESVARVEVRSKSMEAERREVLGKRRQVRFAKRPDATEIERELLS